MKKVEKKKVAEYLGFVFVVGAVLFVSLNTAEAKKLLNYVLTILTPFVYGFCIAYVVNMLVKPIDGLFAKGAAKRGKQPNKKAYRVWSIIIALVVTCAFVALTVGMIIPNLKSTVVSFYKRAPELWQNFLDFLDSFKVKQPKLAGVITKVETEIDGYFAKATKWLSGNWSNILSKALTGIKSASNVAFNFAIGIVIAFGMLIYKELLVKEVYMIMCKILPQKWYGYFCYVQNLTNKKFQIFLKYNVVQAVITGAGIFLVMIVTGMPYKISITLLVTVTQLVPIIGAIVGTVVSGLLIAAENPLKAVIFVILSIIIQQLVEKLINPHLMGKELDMPGLLTFIVICLGGRQFGLIGLICAVPVVSVFYDIYTLKLRPKLKEQTEKKLNL